MNPNPARLRWLIRLDDDEEELQSSSSSVATDQDLLAALRSLPPSAAEEGGEGEEGGGPVNGGGARPRAARSQQRLPRGDGHARPIDRRRALASCLAQHVAVCFGLGIEWERSPGISRTVKGGKPFVARKRERERREEEGSEKRDAGAAAADAGADADAPNFNFNVSHDGPWLALAAEPLLLVGVDVSSPRVIGGRGAAAAGGGGGGRGTGAGNGNSGCSESAPRPPPPPLGAALLRRSLGSALADSEWSLVGSEPDAAGQDALFRKFWALREAWSKARGDGLGAADLARAEFSLGGEEGGSSSSSSSSYSSPPPRIALRLDGILQEQWSFEILDLPDGSALAVALGPPSAAVDAGGTFLETLGRAAMTAAEVEEAQRELHLSSREAAAGSGSSSSWRRMSVRALIEEAEMMRKGKKRVPGNFEKEKF